MTSFQPAPLLNLVVGAIIIWEQMMNAIQSRCLATLLLASAMLHCSFGNVSQGAEQLTIRLEGSNLVALEPAKVERRTVLLWRKYDLLAGGWVANACPFDIGKAGKLPMNSSLGLAASCSLDGLGSVTFWLADLASPFKPISNTVTSTVLVKGVGHVPATIDTGTEFTIENAEGRGHAQGRTVVSKGKFIAAGNKLPTTIKYVYSGKTDEGLLLGGGQIDDESWAGLYTAIDIDNAKKAITANDCTPLQGATGGLAAKYRAKRGVELELFSRSNE